MMIPPTATQSIHHGQETSIRLPDGTPVFLRDEPCKACGCYEAFPFRCGCGAEHPDCCYGCGRYVGLPAPPAQEILRPGERRHVAGDLYDEGCAAGPVEHVHAGKKWGST